MKILHLRNYTDDPVKGTTLDSKGGLTVCYLQHTNSIEWNYAICSDEDVFSRKRGRHLATGRFLSRHHNNFFTDDPDLEAFLAMLTSQDKDSIQKHYPIQLNDSPF